MSPTPISKKRFDYGSDCPLRAVIATPLAINQGIAKYYAAGMRDEAVGRRGPQRRRNRPSKSAAKPKSNEKAAQGPQTLQGYDAPKSNTNRSSSATSLCAGRLSAPCCSTSLCSKGISFRSRRLNVIPFDQFFLTLFIPVIAIWWVLKVYCEVRFPHASLSPLDPPRHGRTIARQSPTELSGSRRR